MAILISDVKNTPIAKLFSGVSTGHVFIMVDTTFGKGAVVEVEYDLRQKVFAVKNANTPKWLVIPTFKIDPSKSDKGINQVIDQAVEWEREEMQKKFLREFVLEMRRNGEL